MTGWFLTIFDSWPIFDGESENFLESMGIKFEFNQRTSEPTDKYAGEFKGESTRKSTGSLQSVMKCEC